MSALPTWDLTPYFPSIQSPELAFAFDALRSDIERFQSALEAQADLEQLIALYNQISAASERLGSYVYAHVTTDSMCEASSKALGQLEIIFSKFQQVQPLWVERLAGSNLEQEAARSEVVSAHLYPLQRAAKLKKHMMSPELEHLASELLLSGGNAWGNLHGGFTSQITARVDHPSTPDPLTISEIRNLAYSHNESVREAAYRAELAAWEDNKTVVIACLNGVKGSAITLHEGRGWESPLAPSLYSSSISRRTLDAMLGAAKKAFPTFRRYLRAKARLLKKDKLAFYDLFAPVGGGGGNWEWPEAETFIADQFSSYSNKMGDFARRAYENRWVDAGPRKGKRDGAYCTGFADGNSRILMNYKPSFGGASTLAHELGHAYHNLCLKERTMLQQQTPMTLAETASIFCETIVRRAALKNADANQRLEILEASLTGACQVVVDITSRFLFESAFFEARKSGTVSASEACEMMRQAQLETYGDGLDSEKLHPYMWAAKPHYYTVEEGFYNYPYMFGLLFAVGLYAVYEERGEAFLADYDQLLSRTGLASAEDLAKDFGIDIEQEAFWASSLKKIEDEIDEYERLANSV